RWQCRNRYRSSRSCGKKYFFFQGEDGIRDRNVTGVQTCALPILDEYIETLTKENEDLKKRHAQQDKKENKNDKTINKIKEMEKQIDKIDDDLKEAREIHEVEGNTLDLAAGIYFETPYELVYNSGAST